MLPGQTPNAWLKLSHYLHVLPHHPAMERRERLVAHRALAGLIQILRQWEALHNVSSSDLAAALDDLARSEYLLPSHAGL